jgi:membrane fusion protein (multidrug efflux system)
VALGWLEPPREEYVRLQRVRLTILILSAVCLVASVIMCATSPERVAEREREARAAGSLPEVSACSPTGTGSLGIRVQRVSRELVQITAEISVVLAPARSVILAAEVSGRVVEVAAQEHAHVEEGELLLRLEPAFLKAAADRTEGALLRAEANYRLAKLELERQRGLAARSVASAADLDRAEAEERARFAELFEARAALADARTRLAKTEIQAPFAGIVNMLDLEPGAFVSVGHPAVELLDLSEVEIEAGVTDRQVVVLHPGDPVAVDVDVYPDEVFKGTITRVGRAHDPQTHKYPVEIRVPNPGERLLAGMIGRVRFDLGEQEAAIRIPRKATQEEFELHYVFVLEEGEEGARVHRRRIAIRPVPFRRDLIEVTEGLKDGERIAVSGIRELHEGLGVRVVGNGS